MQNKVLVYLLLIFIFPLYSQNINWKSGFGGSLSNANSIAVDIYGNSYTTGYFWGTAGDLGTDNEKAGYILKINSSGKVIWRKMIAEEGTKIKVDKDCNVYIAGRFGYYNPKTDLDPGSPILSASTNGSKDVFVTKLDSVGNLVWSKWFGGKKDDLVRGLSVDNDGNVYTCGVFSDTVDFDPGIGIYKVNAYYGLESVFINKLDKNGNFVSNIKFTGGSSMQPFDMAIDSKGNIYTTGSFKSTVDFDPSENEYNLKTLPETRNGTDAFICKLNKNGLFLWAKQLPSTAEAAGFSLSVYKDSALYISGVFVGNLDADPSNALYNLSSGTERGSFAGKYDLNGNLLWANSWSEIITNYISEENVDNGMTIDGLGNAYVTGKIGYTTYFSSLVVSATGLGDIYVAKIKKDGKFDWARQFGDEYSDGGRGIGADNEGNVYLAGYITSPYGSRPFTTIVYKLGSTVSGIKNDNQERKFNNNFLVYPNPIKDHFKVSFPGSEAGVIKLYDLLGHVYYSKSIHNDEILTPDIPKGIYTIEIILLDGSILRDRIIKE